MQWIEGAWAQREEAKRAQGQIIHEPAFAFIKPLYRLRVIPKPTLSPTSPCGSDLGGRA